MYRVFFDTDRRSRRRGGDYCDKLRQLKRGSEVNVHVGDVIYYNASFLAFDPVKQTASFLIDRFYNNGNNVKILDCRAITSIDFPRSSPFGVEEEDE